MKKIFKSLAALALIAFAASCSKEQAPEAIPSGEEALVSFTVSTPALQTKAIADGNTVDKVSCNVYDAEGVLISNSEISKTIAISGGKVTFSVRLVTGQTYSFIFWAYNEAGAHYTLDAANKKVTVSYTDAASNDESRDAFYAYVAPLQVTGAINKTVTLYRPFAQVNFGVTKADITAAKNAGIEVAKSSVKLTGLATELNLVDGSVSGSADAEFSLAVLPAEDLTVGTTDYGYVAMNYALVGKDAKSLSNAELKLYDSADAVINTVSVPNIPLQGNYRTNILGNLFTSEANFNLVVDPAFEDEELVNLENINCISALEALFLNGGSAVLAEDLTLSEPVTVAAGKGVILDLGGHSITNSGTDAAIIVNGDLTINGEGTVDGGEGGNNRAIQVNAGGNLTINGGTFKVGADADGLGNTTIYSYEGNVTINGGTFSSEAQYANRYWVVNKKNGTKGVVKITGGTFINFNPADPTTDDDDSYLAEGYKSIEESGAWTVISKSIVLNSEELAEQALVANSTITLKSGTTYTLPTAVADGITVKGASKDAIIEANSAVTYGGLSVTFENLTWKNSSDNYIGIQHSKSVTYKNCIIEGRPTMYATTATFDSCTFKQSAYDYCIWTYGSQNISFTGCTFDTMGKAVKIYNESPSLQQTATFSGCTFKATNIPEGKGKAAIEVDSRKTTSGNYAVVVNNCKVDGFVAGEFSGDTLWNVEGTNATVTVDGVKKL